MWIPLPIFSLDFVCKLVPLPSHLKKCFLGFVVHCRRCAGSASSALRRYSSALRNMAITAASCRALRLAVFDSCNWDPAALPQ